MARQSVEVLPRVYGRIGGLLYLVIIVGGSLPSYSVAFLALCAILLNSNVFGSFGHCVRHALLRGIRLVAGTSSGFASRL